MDKNIGIGVAIATEPTIGVATEADGTGTIELQVGDTFVVLDVYTAECLQDALQMVIAKSRIAEQEAYDVAEADDDLESERYGRAQ